MLDTGIDIETGDADSLLGAFLHLAVSLVKICSSILTAMIIQIYPDLTPLTIILEPFSEDVFGGPPSAQLMASGLECIRLSCKKAHCEKSALPGPVSCILFPTSHYIRLLCKAVEAGANLSKGVPCLHVASFE